MASTLAAKALACTEAIKLGFDLRIMKVVIEGDVMSVIKICKSKHIDKLEIGAYICNIQGNLNQFQDIDFLHINRSGNKLINIISTKSLRKGDRFNLVDAVPNFIATALTDGWIREPD